METKIRLWNVLEKTCLRKSEAGRKIQEEPETANPSAPGLGFPGLAKVNEEEDKESEMTSSSWSLLSNPFWWGCYSASVRAMTIKNTSSWHGKWTGTGVLLSPYLLSHLTLICLNWKRLGIIYQEDSICVATSVTPLLCNTVSEETGTNIYSTQTRNCWGPRGRNNKQLRSHGVWPPGFHNHMGVPRYGTAPRTTCPKDFTLLWSSALLAALTSFLI